MGLGVGGDWERGERGRRWPKFEKGEGNKRGSLLYKRFRTPLPAMSIHFIFL